MSDEITLTLMTTLKCNFKCEHCMFRSGPDLPNVWMQDDVIYRALEVKEILRENEFPVEWNIIGGEPTLDPDHLHHVLTMIGSDWDPLYMVTNGWWLNTQEDTRRVMQAIAPWVDGTGDGLQVRISNDVHHDPFRPEWLTNRDRSATMSGMLPYQEPGHDALRERLAEIWACSFEFQIFDEQHQECVDCEHEPEYNMDSCPKCGGELEYYEREIMGALPEPNPDDPWISVDLHRDGFEDVIPTGRANWFGRSEKHNCDANTLTIRPNGDVWDYCCRGSMIRHGTIFDDPIWLLDMASRYMREVKPKCSTCSKTAAQWVQSNLGG